MNPILIPFESAVQLPRFHTKAGEQFIDLGRIVYLKAQLNYTLFHLVDGEQVVTSLSLSTYARLLEPCGFVRLHKSCLLNGQYLSQCSLKSNHQLVLPDGKRAVIARRRRTMIKKNNTINRFWKGLKYCLRMYFMFSKISGTDKHDRNKSGSGICKIYQS